MKSVLKKRLLAKLILILVLISTISTFAFADQRMDKVPYAPSNHTPIESEASAITEQEVKQEPYVEDGVLMCSCGIPHKEHIEQTKQRAYDEDGLEAYTCECGGIVLITETPTKWFYTKECEKCSHHYYGHDYEMKRFVIVDFRCSECCYKYSIVKQEFKWDCKGW